MTEYSFNQRMKHLQGALAKVLKTEVEFPNRAFVTVLATKMTRNQTHAKVILSVMPNTMETDVLATLKERDHEIKHALAKELRLRHIPDFYWAFDETEAEAEAIDQAINELKRKGEL